MDEFVFKTHHPSVRAAKGPGLQSATAFEALMTPISLSDLDETHQGPTALLGPVHAVLALCLSPGWILGCSSVSSPVSASISWWSGLDPGAVSYPHLIQGSASWLKPLWHNEPSVRVWIMPDSPPSSQVFSFMKQLCSYSSLLFLFFQTSGAAMQTTKKSLQETSMDEGAGDGEQCFGGGWT